MGLEWSELDKGYGGTPLFKPLFLWSSMRATPLTTSSFSESEKRGKDFSMFDSFLKHDHMHERNLSALACCRLTLFARILGLNTNVERLLDAMLMHFLVFSSFGDFKHTYGSKKTSNKINGWYVWMSFTSAQHACKQNKNLSNFPALGQIHNTSVNGPIDEQEASVVDKCFFANSSHQPLASCTSFSVFCAHW